MVQLALSLLCGIFLLVASKTAALPLDYCYKPTKEVAECKICAPGSYQDNPQFLCVDGYCVNCYDPINYENLQNCINAGCIKPKPNQCKSGDNCKGCSSGKECVNGECLDCNAQQNYKACAAAGCS